MSNISFAMVMVIMDFVVETNPRMLYIDESITIDCLHLLNVLNSKYLQILSIAFSG